MMASNDQETEWELSKENVQPLRQGRKFSNLTAALQPQADQQAKLKEERQNFEVELRTYNGDDPLSVWHRYILWMEQNFPKGGRSNLSQLIEQCVSQFKDVEKYKNDPRYLDIWVKFANFCNEPTEIFSFMFSNEICTELAAFYEAWASECETLGNMKRADSLYKQGLEKFAYPVDWLEKRHKDFQARVAAHLARGDPLTEETLPNPAEPERIKLGQLKGHGKSKKVGSQRQAMVRPATVGTAPAPGSASNARGQAFTIFEERENTLASHLPPQTGEWNTVPKRAEVNSENELKPGKWTDAKIRQRPAGATSQHHMPIAPTFQIHEDDEAAKPTATPRKVVPEVNLVLSSRKPPKPQDPLQHLMVISGGDKQASMYCKHLVYVGTQEFSLEEIRAAHLEKLRAAQEEQERMERLRVERERLEEELKQQRQELAAVLEQKMKAEQEVQQQQKVIPPQTLAPRSDVRPAECIADASLEIQVPPASVSFAVTDAVKRVVSVENSPVYSPTQTDPVVQLGSFKPPRSVGAPTPANTTSDHENISGPLQPGLVRPGFRTPQDSLHTSNYSGFTSSEPPSVEPTPIKSIYMNPYRPSSNGPTPMGGGMCAPSPTINTKEALKTVMNMFNQTLNQMPWSDSSKPDSADCSIETKPVQVPAATPFTVFVEENVQPKKPSVTPVCAPSNDENDSRPSAIRPRLGLGSRRHGLGPALQPREEPPAMVEPIQEPSPIATNLPEGPSLPPAPEPVMYMATGGTEYQPMMEYCQPLREEDDIVMDDDKTVARPRDSDDYFDNNFGEDLTFAPYLSSTRNFTDMARLISTPFNPLGEAPQMPDPPMSSIKGDAGRHIGAEAMGVMSDATLGAMMTSQHEVSSVNRSVPVMPNASSGNQTAPSGMDYTEDDDYSKRKANLSPITECSDEDTKLGASSMAASHFHCDPRAALGDLSQATAKNTTTTSTANTTASTTSPDPQPNSPHFVMPKIPMQKDTEGKGADTHNHWASKAAAAYGLNQTCHEIDVTNYHLEDDLLQDLLSQSVIVNPYSDPFDADLIEEFLGRLEVPIEKYSNYHRVDSDMPAMKAKRTVQLGINTYDVIQRLGEGAFAQVYTVCPTDGPEEEVKVIKVQTPPCPWEYYIAYEMHRRLRENKLLVTPSIMHIDEAYFFDDGSCFVNDLLPRGTLLDVMNLVRQTRTFLPEAIILYMCIEMLRILESMMAIDMIHGDVKPDNFLFRGLPYLPEDVRTHLKGETQCLRLIDFGRSIDMRMFPTGCSFGVCVETSGFQCIEMKTQRPWTYQTDMFGVVGTMHVIIFGEYMNITHDGKKWKPTSRFKRWFRAQGLMQHIFDELLNVESCSSLPDVGALRRKLEETFLSDYAAVYNKKLKDVDTSLIKDR